ncbi:hypothetical protein ACVGOW_29175 [Pseudonocardia saturnea]
MSRHRSPAGRHARPRSAPQAAAIPGAWPRRSDAQHAPEGARPGGGVALLEHPAPAPAAAPPGDFADYAREWADRLGAATDDAAADGPPAVAPRVGARHATAPAVRNGLMAAAATAGLLSVAAPMVPVVPPAGTAALALTSDGSAVAAAAEGPATAEAPTAAAPVADLVDGRLLAASVLPVLAPAEALPPEADASSLLKAAGLADIARAAEEQRLAREAAANCDTSLRGLGSVKDFVRDAARFLSCLYEQPTLIGVAGRARVSDHPRGLAVDFMTGRERGDLIADCALANQEALGISYVIWRQRVNYGDGWEPMSDRGSATENHYDHVHVSFERGGGSGGPLAGLCT